MFDSYLIEKGKMSRLVEVLTAAAVLLLLCHHHGARQKIQLAPKRWLPILNEASRYRYRWREKSIFLIGARRSCVGRLSDTSLNGRNRSVPFVLRVASCECATTTTTTTEKRRKTDFYVDLCVIFALVTGQSAAKKNRKEAD
jgi:hypothetical protein